MKRDIQAKLYQRWKGLSSKEIMEEIRKDMAKSTDPFIVMWRKLPTAAEHQAEKVRKSQAKKKPS